MNLRAGTLDDTSWLMPLAHLYTGSAQAWVQPRRPVPNAMRLQAAPDFSALDAQNGAAMWPEFFPEK